CFPEIERLLRCTFDQPAKSAFPRCGGWLTAARTGVQQFHLRIRLGGKEAFLTSLKKPQVKRQFSPRPVFLQPVENFFVVQRLRPDGVGTLLVNILDAAQQGISGHFALVETAERFYL